MISNSPLSAFQLGPSTFLIPLKVNSISLTIIFSPNIIGFSISMRQALETVAPIINTATPI